MLGMTCNLDLNIPIFSSLYCFDKQINKGKYEGTHNHAKSEKHSLVSEREGSTTPFHTVSNILNRADMTQKASNLET